MPSAGSVSRPFVLVQTPPVPGAFPALAGTRSTRFGAQLKATCRYIQELSEQPQLSLQHYSSLQGPLRILQHPFPFCCFQLPRRGQLERFKPQFKHFRRRWKPSRRGAELLGCLSHWGSVLPEIRVVSQLNPELQTGQEATRRAPQDCWVS